MSMYANLRHLLGSYLHQDFADEFPSALQAVRAFAQHEPAAAVQGAAKEIHSLLADARFRSAPQEVLFKLGCYYNPSADGLAAHEWLRQVQRELRKGPGKGRVAKNGQ